MASEFQRLQGAPGAVTLEGLHALKHAIRFGAEVRRAVTPDKDAILRLAADLAPDLVPRLQDLLVTVPAEEFRRLSSRPPASPVLAVADRRDSSPGDALLAGHAPVVLLDQPRHAGNVGAVIRVAAAGGAGAVLVTGALDPWSTPVLRTATGLHYAVEVSNALLPLDTTRPVLALDPDGDELVAGSLPADAVLAFGSERHGLTPELLARADRVLALPMREHVSSLNLATSVAAVLYAWRLR